MYRTALLPALICYALAAIGVLIMTARRCRQRREAERLQAEKAAAAALAKAEREAKKAEAAAARAAEASHTPKRKRGRPRKIQPDPVAGHSAPVTPASESPAPDPVRPETVSVPALPFKGNNMFAGHVVAFTGTLKDMTRAEAIKAVEANGGRAFDTMPAGTTLLVVGENPGAAKLDKADKWIGQTCKITQERFKFMLSAPLTCTPDQFAAAFAPVNE